MTVVDQPASDPRIKHRNASSTSSAQSSSKTAKYSARNEARADRLPGCWEFPGGKIEPHETARQALHHEIEEELMCDIEVADKVCISSYDYDFGTVVLTSFICHY